MAVPRSHLSGRLLICRSQREGCSGCGAEMELTKRHLRSDSARQVTKTASNSALELVQRPPLSPPRPWPLQFAQQTDRPGGCGLQKLLEEQLVLETSLVTTVPRMGFSAPGISRPGVLCAPLMGLGLTPQPSCKRRHEGEYLVVCLPVKGQLLRWGRGPPGIRRG